MQIIRDLLKNWPFIRAVRDIFKPRLILSAAYKNCFHTLTYKKCFHIPCLTNRNTSLNAFAFTYPPVMVPQLMSASYVPVAISSGLSAVTTSQMYCLYSFFSCAFSSMSCEASRASIFKKPYFFSSVATRPVPAPRSTILKLLSASPTIFENVFATFAAQGQLESGLRS